MKSCIFGNSVTLKATVARGRRHWPLANFLCNCANSDEMHHQYGLAVCTRSLEFRWGLNRPDDRMRRTSAKLAQPSLSEIGMWQWARRVLDEQYDRVDIISGALSGGRSTARGR